MSNHYWPLFPSGPQQTVAPRRKASNAFQVVLSRNTRDIGSNLFAIPSLFITQRVWYLIDPHSPGTQIPAASLSGQTRHTHPTCTCIEGCTRCTKYLVPATLGLAPRAREQANNCCLQVMIKSPISIDAPHLTHSGVAAGILVTAASLSTGVFFFQVLIFSPFCY
jgi:hypothetical protein